MTNGSDAAEPVGADPRRIEDRSLELADTTTYYVECCAFLDEFLDGHEKLAGQEIRQKVRQLLEWMCSPPEERIADAAQDVAIDLHLFGMIGKAVYFCRDEWDNPQFVEEIRRLFSDYNQFRGNLWLFYTAGMFAREGFAIEFLAEQSKEGLQTPDYRASRDGLSVSVEANARSQAHKDINNIAGLLWEVMHGGKESGKQLKFVDPKYDPGMIVVDVSNCDVTANATGLPPHVKLRKDACVACNDRGFVYSLDKDPDFFGQLQNTGNLVEYGIRYFHMMSEKNRYCVRAILIGMAMKIVSESDNVAAPKGSVLIVDSRYPQLAIQELSRSIYLVDTQKPLPEAPTG